MRPQIPICKLSVLACDECVEHYRCDQRIHSGDTRWIPIEVIFGNPFVRMTVRPRVQAFRTLPVEGFIICHKRSGKCAHCCCFGQYLGRIARRRRHGSELACRGQQERFPVWSRDVARVCAKPFARARRYTTHPNGIRTIQLCFGYDPLADCLSQLQFRARV